MSKQSANGSTRRWRYTRALKLRANPECEWPEPCGREAVEVDHIKQLKDGGDRFALGNLRSLCAVHHKRRHGKQPKPVIDPKTGLPIANHWWSEK
jgi:5-methylcytosine-specific restriction endonuclease McrA